MTLVKPRLSRFLHISITIAWCGAYLFGACLYSASLAFAQPKDLELFSIRNGESVQLSQLPSQITLINFWRSDCPPCVKELPMLVQSANSLGFRLMTVSVQTLTETKSLWQVVPGNPNQHIALLAPSNPNGLLRRFGNNSGAIPHSVLLNAQNEICSKRTGEINEKWIAENLLKCQ